MAGFFFGWLLCVRRIFIEELGWECMVMLGEGMSRRVLLDRRVIYLMCLSQGVCFRNEVKLEVILSEGG